MTTAPDSAYIWYARATAIDPDRETAWRFWSNVLRKNQRFDEARDRAIDAIVAEPYNRVSRQALGLWAQATRTPIWLPTVSLADSDTNATRTAARIAYDSVLARWKGRDSVLSREFATAYPGEPSYRRSLAEERDALRAAYRAGASDAATSNLQKLDDGGMLDAFILFARADAGIARDYEAYRLANRDRLRKFWAEYAIGGKYR